MVGDDRSNGQDLASNPGRRAAWRSGRGLRFSGDSLFMFTMPTGRLAPRSASTLIQTRPNRFRLVRFRFDLGMKLLQLRLAGRQTQHRLGAL